jgi:hypothetical protein
MMGAVRPSVAMVTALMALECAHTGLGKESGIHIVTAAKRQALLRQAQVWRKTDIPAVDIKAGPQSKDAFPPDSTIACDYVNETLGGNTPKFGCTLSKEDHLKVRYGRNNGEVYASVAATRLLWALGFGADAMYPVHVVCRGCPDAMKQEGEAGPGFVRFDIAAIERKMPGQEVEAPSVGAGWSWAELDLVDERDGGAPLAQRDALKLLAVMLQHTDNKAEQQKLLCMGEHVKHGECHEPFLMIHDVGQTFGAANLFNRGTIGSVNLERWSQTPVWKDPVHCFGNLAPSQTGTLANPHIAEAGRKFLADELTQLSDGQIRDLFTVARFADKPGGSPVDAWVAAFKHKREEIASATCH